MQSFKYHFGLEKWVSWFITHLLRLLFYYYWTDLSPPDHMCFFFFPLLKFLRAKVIISNTSTQEYVSAHNQFLIKKKKYL